MSAAATLPFQDLPAEDFAAIRGFLAPLDIERLDLSCKYQFFTHYLGIAHVIGIKEGDLYDRAALAQRVCKTAGFLGLDNLQEAKSIYEHDLLAFINTIADETFTDALAARNWFHQPGRSFERITELDLSEKELQTLPSEIGKLTKLASLRLKNNDLRKLPSGLAGMNIEKLYLAGNIYLQSLPGAIDRATIRDLNPLEIAQLSSI